MTYTLYGAPVSLYSGKARSYLRTQGIDFVEMTPGSQRYLEHIVPMVGRWIIPCLEAPDGEVIQDSSDIIDYFERGAGQIDRKFSVYPSSRVLLSISQVFELFGGEGLLRPAMHYRWNFDELNLTFLTDEFSLLTPGVHHDEEAFRKNSGRMRKAAINFGVTPESAETIESAFEEWLDLFSAHLADHPYLLGGHPTIGDFGLVAALWAHLYRDPAPSMLIKKRAPKVGRWVERMTTAEPYLHEYPETRFSLFDEDDLPETLTDLMAYVAEEYVSEIRAHVEVANQWLEANPDIEPGTNGLENPAARGLLGGGGLVGSGAATFEWRGQNITTGVMPYRFWLLQRIQDVVAASDTQAKTRIRSLFSATGLEELIDLRTIRRVERRNHLEIWGPLRS